MKQTSLVKLIQKIPQEGWIAGATLIGLILYWLLHIPFPFITNIYIGVVILGVVPLCISIVTSIANRQYGVDLIALIAIASSLLFHEYIAAGVVLLMLSGGELLERFAQRVARRNLSSLIRRVPELAHCIITDGSIIDKALSAVVVGDHILVKQNEIIPVDGVVVSGESSVDESAITGEPVPKTLQVSDRVLSGSVNGSEVLRIRVTTTHQNSTYAQLVRLIESSENNRAPFVRMADRYSVVFTVITFAICTAGYMLTRDPKIVVAILVVATPCPLILAAPIAFIAGMSRTAGIGIIVKNGGVFEKIVNAKAVFFDKTGTVTYGIPELPQLKQQHLFTQHSCDLLSNF